MTHNRRPDRGNKLARECKIEGCARKISPESHLCGLHAGQRKHWWDWHKRQFNRKTTATESADKFRLWKIVPGNIGQQQ